MADEISAAIADKDPDSFVFSGRFGEPLITPTVRDNSWFDKALAAAALPPMTIHDLRHTAASLAISSGANVKAVQKMLGHASAGICQVGWGQREFRRLVSDRFRPRVARRVC